MPVKLTIRARLETHINASHFGSIRHHNSVLLTSPPGIVNAQSKENFSNCYIPTSWFLYRL